MTTKLFFLFFILTTSVIYGQEDTKISTIDIDNFWVAYDLLPDCKTKTDSINTFQVNYIDKATEGFKAFLKVRDFTAEEYYNLIVKYPKFWQSIRPNTLRVHTIRKEIEEIYAQYETAFPNQAKPKICFAIGGLRTGGTVADGYLLIGTEIAAADKTTDKSELGVWLNGAMTDDFEIRNMIAHEYVHALQELKFSAAWGYRNYRVLMQSVYEGAADFIAEKVTGATTNKDIYVYGNAHEAAIWNKFKVDMWSNDTYKWLYQGNDTEEGVPADLGYFVGYKICQSYYEKAKNKEQALRDILGIKNYKKFYIESGYGKRF